jgi:hypothetical protein
VCFCSMNTPHNLLALCAAAWYWNQSQQEPPPKPIYRRAKCVAFTRTNRWEPWHNNWIPTIQFLELFRMTLPDFQWLSDKLCGELQQEHLCRRNPLTVEAQVAVGLYWLAHGVSYVTIGHIFNISKETADKATGQFVNAVLKNLRLQTVR